MCLLHFCQDPLTFYNLWFLEDMRGHSKSSILSGFLSSLRMDSQFVLFSPLKLINFKHTVVFERLSLWKVLHLYKERTVHTELHNQNMASCLMRNQIQIHGREAQLQPFHRLHVWLGNEKEKIKRDRKPSRERKSMEEEHRERNPSPCWGGTLTIKRLATQSNPKLFLHMLVPLVSTGLSDAAILN